jgi:fumarylacetoacetate (FAA) hydrolase
VKLVSYRGGGGGEHVGELRDGDRVAELEAASMVDWLAGAGHEPAGPEHALAELRLLAPIPRPPSVRDFYAYEEHVRTGSKLRGAEIAPAWYEAPTFYFSNPAAIFGPGEPVRRPAGSRRLDFELEIAVALGAEGSIAGFMLMNDWSARDLQAKEMTVGLGPAKGKDFATSLGPWLVTPDELPYDGERLDLEASVTVNDRVVTRTPSQPMQFSWPELVAHAARNTVLHPGDVLGSGTLNRGCLLELGPIDGRWIEPGDVVTLSAPGLGELRTPVTA